MNALIHLDEQGLDSPKHTRCRAMSLFECCDAGNALRAGLRRVFAALPHDAERFLGSRYLMIELDASLFESGNLRLPHRDDRFLFGTLSGKSLQLSFGNAHALGDARHFRIELLEHVAGGHRLMFRFALLTFETLQQGSEVFDFSAQHKHPHLFFTQSAFQLLKLAQDFAQFTLRRAACRR